MPGPVAILATLRQTCPFIDGIPVCMVNTRISGKAAFPAANMAVTGEFRAGRRADRCPISRCGRT